MYYQDETRRFNFLSGLAAGAVLGAGLALVFLPQKPRRSAPARASFGSVWKNRAAGTVEQLRGAVGRIEQVLPEG